MKEFLKKYIPFCALLFACFAVLAPRSGHPFDIFCWTEWSLYSFNEGLSNIYQSNTDYLPLYHYILAFFGWLQGSVHKIKYNIHYLKLITIIFQFISGYFLALTVRTDKDTWSTLLYKVLFYLLNIAILYNALIWGQVDVIMACLLFVAAYFAYKQKITPALVFIVLAINLKLQVIVFFPILGLILLPEMVRTYSPKRFLTWVLALAIPQLLILLPFILSGSVDTIIGVITGSFGKYPYVSMNAYNIWDFFLDGKLNKIPDTTVAMGLSYKSWGLALFFTTSIFALFPLAKQAVLAIAKKTELSMDWNKVLITFALIPLLFFYLNTQMHERYSHPAFIFLIAYAIRKKRPVIAILGCLAYFFNLESVLHFLKLSSYSTLVFDRDFVSALYLVTILWLYIDLYEINPFRISPKRKLSVA